VTVAERHRQIEREREFAESLEKFAGQWVAVRDHKVIANAATPEKLDERLAGQEQPDRTFRVTRGAGATLL
jgi:Family of unknown function (DUF5678)